MQQVVYCYGPFSGVKNDFCKSIIRQNKNFKLIETHKIRKKNTGSIIPGEKESLVTDEITQKCLVNLNKGFSIIVNACLLNKQARILFIKSISKTFKNDFKKIAISFMGQNPIETFEKNKNDKSLNGVSFDFLRSQYLSFKNAETKEEADLLIYEILNPEEKNNFKIRSKTWGEDGIITCKNFQKIFEYFNCVSSF